MIKLLGKIPKGHFHVACSGGSDSMILVDFLRKYPKNKFDILHFNHGTTYCGEAQEFVLQYCLKNNLHLHVGSIKSTRRKSESQEEYWRRERYNFFSCFKSEPILMAHHLNDCIETWIMTSMMGKPRLIPYHNEKYNIFRPFLITPKTEINSWRMRHDVSVVIDGSNFNTDIKRNYVRYNIINHIYQINPGIEKTITKKILEEYKIQMDQFKTLE